MHASKEFKKFGLQFIQDIHLMDETMDDLINNVSIPSNEGERPRLKQFLNEIIDGRVSDADVRHLWASTPANVYFHEVADLRVMLSQARDRR